MSLQELELSNLRQPNGGASDQLARAFLHQLAQDELKRLKASQRAVGYEFGDDATLAEADAVEQIVAQDETDRRATRMSLFRPTLPQWRSCLRAPSRTKTAWCAASVARRRSSPSRRTYPTSSNRSYRRRKVLVPFRSQGRRSRRRTRTRTQPPTCRAVRLRRIGREARPDKGNEVVGSALHVRIPIVGIAPDPKRQLPRISCVRRSIGSHCPNWTMPALRW